MTVSNLCRSTTLCSLLIVSGFIAIRSWDFGKSSTQIVPNTNDHYAQHDYRIQSVDLQIDEATDAEAIAGPSEDTGSGPSTFETPQREPRLFKNVLIPSTYVTYSMISSSYEEPVPVGIVSTQIDLGAPLFSEGSPLFDNELGSRQIDPNSLTIQKRDVRGLRPQPD